MGKMKRMMIGSMISLVAMATVQVSAETVRLANGEWPPFTSEKEFQYHGILSRIVTEAFALEGITVEYSFYPWKRSLEMAKNGESDGSIGWAQGRADLTPDFLFSDPTINIPKALFSLKSKPLIWNTMDDLQGKTIGVTAGYVYGEAFEQARQAGKFNVEEVTYDIQNLQKLLGGRFDAFAMEIDTALYLLQTKFTPEEAAQIMYSPKILVETSQCVIFSKTLAKSANLVEALNRGLQRLKESGKYEQYIAESQQGQYLIAK